MGISPTRAAQIRKVAALDILRDVCKGRRRGVEENVKTGLIVPILEALGWRNPQDMDFEHRKKDGSADILLRHEGGQSLVVECKSIEIRLSTARVQALGYAHARGASFAVLTNGVSWEVLPTLVKGVPIERIIPYYVFTLGSIGRNPDLLYSLISKERFGALEEVAAPKKAALQRRIDEEAFLNSLTRFRSSLYVLIRAHFDRHYPEDPEFRSSVNDWLAKNPSSMEWSWLKEATEDQDFLNLVRGTLKEAALPTDLPTIKRRAGKDGLADLPISRALREAGVPLDWVDKLCFEGAYAFVNRILFLRMYEDRIDPNSRATRSLNSLLPADSSMQAVHAAIQLLFDKVRGLFPSLYDVPLYDNIGIEAVDWEAGVLRSVLEHAQKHNFAELDRDLLGDVYQHHTPRPIRKAFGQFYTDPLICAYMVDRAANLVGATADDVVVDPACGSGTFLLAAYDRMKQELLSSKIKPAAAHEFLLKNTLVGIDIDAFAVQLATMNLLLRDTNVAASVRGVVRGNSLTQTLSSFDTDTAPNGGEALSLTDILRQMRRRSPEGLRLVVGNPPHHPLRQDNPIYSPALDGYFAPFKNGLTNISSVFLVRWLRFLSPGGVLAFILPKVFVWNESYVKVRDWVADNFEVVEIVDLGKAWDEVGLEQIIVFLRTPKKGARPDRNGEVVVVSGVESPELLAENQVRRHVVAQSSLAPLGGSWRLYASDPDFPEMAAVWRTVEQGSRRLADLADIFRGYPKVAVVAAGSSKRGSPSQRAFLAGANIGLDHSFTCWSLALGELLWADPKLVAGEGERGARKLDLITRPKILCKRLVSSDVKVDAFLDEKGQYFSIDTVTNIVPHSDSEVSLDYLYGVLNSILGTVYLRDMVFDRSILTMDMDTPYLGKMPIRIASPRDQIAIGAVAKRIQDTAMNLPRKDWPKAGMRVAGLLEELDHKVLAVYGVEDHYDMFRALRKPGSIDKDQTQLSEFG
ncbi:MAG: N-6 DNA methylase [Thermoplasmata archaeon]|nr:N-6 DNA methylase [Thermoplasmata archaeon]